MSQADAEDDAEDDGLILADTDEDGLRLADGDALTELDGLTEALGDRDGELDGLTDALWLRDKLDEGETEADGEPAEPRLPPSQLSHPMTSLCPPMPTEPEARGDDESVAECRSVPLTRMASVTVPPLVVARNSTTSPAV